MKVSASANGIRRARMQQKDSAIARRVMPFTVRHHGERGWHRIHTNWWCSNNNNSIGGGDDDDVSSVRCSVALVSLRMCVDSFRRVPSLRTAASSPAHTRTTGTFDTKAIVENRCERILFVLFCFVLSFVLLLSLCVYPNFRLCVLCSSLCVYRLVDLPIL